MIASTNVPQLDRLEEEGLLWKEAEEVPDGEGVGDARAPDSGESLPVRGL